jgi:L-rhamnose mutarotase
MARLPLKRLAQVIRLRPDAIDEYERIHRDVPAPILARLRSSHMTNYSIFRYGTLLVAYLEYTGDDFETDSEAIAADPATQAWWRTTEPQQEPVPERAPGEWWHEIAEVFHLD